MCEECVCPLLLDATAYRPDLLDLNTDEEAGAYWFPRFREMVTKYAEQASKDGDATAPKRAEEYRQDYLSKLDEYQSLKAINAKNGLVLGTRNLLELSEVSLRRHGFGDPWQRQKQLENARALELFEQRLKEIDKLPTNGDERWLALVRGVLAGNMFDWGAKEVANILESNQKFGLHEALERIQVRPWLTDDLDGVLDRLRKQKPHKCVIIFVDNSGVDIVLGIVPFVREFLRRGSKVLLSANSEPSLNDVTSAELSVLLESCSCHCPIIGTALREKHLLVYGNGQRGPCLDLRTLPKDLCDAIETNETDLIVIEGMGRALHTNLYAKFRCEVLKLAVIKNQWLAEKLGGQIFSVICKYEG